MINWEQQFADQFIAKLLDDNEPMETKTIQDLIDEVTELEAIKMERYYGKE